MNIRDCSILHVITRLDRGGSADVVLDLARMLKEDGFRVGIAVGKTVDPQEDIDAYSARYGIPVFSVPSLVREISPAKDIAAVCEVRLVIRRFGPDIVHTHTSKAGIVGRIAARLTGRPRIVHTPHGHVFYGYFDPFTTRAFILAERLAAYITDRIVTLTGAGRDDHLHFGIGTPDKYRVIPSGIDIGRFKGGDGSCVRAEIGSGSAPVIGWAGRLVPVKDCKTFLRAMAIVLKDHPDVYVVVAGDGEERESLVRLAEELGISVRVRFIGDRRDMPSVLASFDVFVLSSVNEGFGRVIIEAMAAGAPVVSTAVGGTPEVIDDGVNGMLVPPGDPVKLAAAVRRVLVEPGLADRLRIQSRLTMDRYTTRFMVDAYEEIYRDLLGRRGSQCGSGGAGGR